MDFSIFSTKVCEKDKSVPRVTVWNHLVDLVMQNSNPWDRIVHPIHKLMIDSYTLTWRCDPQAWSVTVSLVPVINYHR